MVTVDVMLALIITGWGTRMGLDDMRLLMDLV